MKMSRDTHKLNKIVTSSPALLEKLKEAVQAEGTREMEIGVYAEGRRHQNVHIREHACVCTDSTACLK